MLVWHVWSLGGFGVHQRQLSPLYCCATAPEIDHLMHTYTILSSTYTSYPTNSHLKDIDFDIKELTLTTREQSDSNLV